MLRVVLMLLTKKLLQSLLVLLRLSKQLDKLRLMVILMAPLVWLVLHRRLHQLDHPTQHLLNQQRNKKYNQRNLLLLVVLVMDLHNNKNLQLAYEHLDPNKQARYLDLYMDMDMRLGKVMVLLAMSREL